MALALTVDTLDSVPEALRSEYTEKDGKFVLSVEGMEDTTGLKNALNAERKRAKDFEAKTRKWEALGKTDEEIAALLAANEDAEAKKAAADGDHAKILKQHQDKWAKERADLEGELGAARASERGAIIGSSIMAALTKAGATEEGADLLPDRLAARIKFETENGARVIKIMQADGETPMAGIGKDGAATFDDLVKEAVTKWPSLFKGSGNTGTGKEPGKGSQSSAAKSIARSEFSKLGPDEQMSKIRDGFTVTE
jgi:hypothetical protein